MVNAGGACGAWLPGREKLREFRGLDRIEGTGGLLCREPPSFETGLSERLLAPELARICGREHLTSSCNGWCRTPRSVAAIAGAPS